MNSTLKTFIPLERLEHIIQFEPALIILIFVLIAWIFQKLFLRDVSQERKANLSKLFGNLALHLLVWPILILGYEAVLNTPILPEKYLLRIASYLGFSAIISGAIVFIKTFRILALEYLFFGSKRQGVPILLVNLFTLVLSFMVGGWLLAEIFELRLAPLLATSAAVSLVLGLALQDTLGNLFAGVALQFDKPYEIGEWIEVQNGPQKWVGQVTEITWRATVLLGFFDERVTIPNRIMGQSEIANFSAKTQPFCRTQMLRLPYGVDIPGIKKLLADAALQAPGIKKHPLPFAYIWEAADSYLVFKIVYFIDNYGQQYIIGDQVLDACIHALSKANVPVAAARIQVEGTSRA